MLRIEKDIAELLKSNGYVAFDNVLRPQKLDDEIVYIVKIPKDFSSQRDNDVCGAFSGEFTFTISALTPQIISVEEVQTKLEDVYNLIVANRNSIKIVDSYDETTRSRGYLKEGGYVMDLEFTAQIYHANI